MWLRFINTLTVMLDSSVSLIRSEFYDRRARSYWSGIKLPKSQALVVNKLIHSWKFHHVLDHSRMWLIDYCLSFIMFFMSMPNTLPIARVALDRLEYLGKSFPIGQIRPSLADGLRRRLRGSSREIWERHGIQRVNNESTKTVWW